jgi:hypothetical protein
MPKLVHPLKAWMEDNGLGRDYEAVADMLPSSPTGESIRQVANGYRLPGWGLAFELEAATKISAHDLRDERWYPRRSAA